MQGGAGRLSKAVLNEAIFTGIAKGYTVLATDLHYDTLVFASFEEFRPFLEANYPHWPDQVQEAIRLIALHGIRDPITEASIAAADLELVGSNYRETLSHKGIISRQRAVYLLLRQLVEAGRLPPFDQIRLFIPEAVTVMGLEIFDLIPNTISSEYLPDDSSTFSGRAIHQDLCKLTLPDACRDLVICNELFEHLYDLPAALAHLARVLVPGGKLIGTFPFALNDQTTITKARHRAGGDPELLAEVELHGNPVDSQGGSLVYQIPGWDLLDLARSVGFKDAVVHWISAPSYGVLGSDTPAVFVLEASR